MGKKIDYTSLCCNLWPTVMLAGPEEGDHFTLNLFNKVIPPPTQILKYWIFLKNFLFVDIFSGYIYVSPTPPKLSNLILIFAKIGWVKG